MSEQNDSFRNYFNYFTEIEEHFQRARGTSLFLLSPLDWALIESWKTSGIPLEAVLRGIDAAFEKWRAKKSRIQMVNSIAYCTQAVMAEAQRMADTATGQPAAAESAPFPLDELRSFIAGNATAVRNTKNPDFGAVADSLETLLPELEEKAKDLESLEQHLTVLEQKLIALARTQQTDEQALQIRREMEAHLKPWKGKMTAPQIGLLEAQYLDRSVLAAAGLPRLSLFYLH